MGDAHPAGAGGRVAGYMSYYDACEREVRPTMDKCPGQDLRFLTTEEIPCPSCGTLVELFSDEQKRRCHACGARVTRDAAPMCAAWCSSARSCLGEERYDRLVAEKALEAPHEEPADTGSAGGQGGAVDESDDDPAAPAGG